MKPHQIKFYDFIMLRSKEENKLEMDALLKEASTRQDNDTFDLEYLKEYNPKLLALLKDEYVEEVKKITSEFKND